MKILDYLKSHNLILDGGMGTLLQAKGLCPGEAPAYWNITHPDIIANIHKSYFDAGSNVVCTNTFGVNALKFSHEEIQKIIPAAIACAKKGMELSTYPSEKFIALDIGPIGRLLKPYGDLDFEDAINLFKEVISLGNENHVDLIFIETMSDCYETKAALLAAKEVSNLPVFVSNSYGEDGKLMTGASPSAMVAMLEGMGADAIGINCSLGPNELMPTIREYIKYASIPVLFKPNAGLPFVMNGETHYNVSPTDFSTVMLEAANSGVRIFGGCCGTTPAYIEAFSKNVSQMQPTPIVEKNLTLVSSYTHIVEFRERPVLIGERINPTGKKKLKQAILENNYTYILNEALRQQDNGADILDVNVGLPEINEVEFLKKTICELQAVTNLPLQIDTSNYDAMEQALRLYNGKALINSVNGKSSSMKVVFPLVKKYGGVVIALTLDENGIPDTVDGRIEIAKKILRTAKKYGISKNNIIFDTLAMTISANTSSALITIEALKEIRNKLHCHVSLGVSNISYGLPKRDIVTSTFFALALENHLSAAIMNPDSVEMMKIYHAYLALHNLDANCQDYIQFATSLQEDVPQTSDSKQSPKTTTNIKGAATTELQTAIINGMKESASELCKKRLSEEVKDFTSIINDEIIPALNIVGKGYEDKTLYLPQLLMSAEAASCAFEVIKSTCKNTQNKADSPNIILATVEGDIHDIGKNIVKLLLENFGFTVVDLGKDVKPETILEAVQKYHSPLVGLSALMTTTVPAMEKTISIVKKAIPSCKIVVGGAVLTKEYAATIGADFYAKDAMETVHFAENILK